jgi:N6-adenosine-specific RNA methylase IME4
MPAKPMGAVADEPTEFYRAPELPDRLAERGSILRRGDRAEPTEAESSPIFVPLPAIAGGWRCVAADPQVGFKTWSEKGQGRSPSRHYDTLTPEAIATLALQTVVADGCSLMLWWPDPHMPTMVEVMRSWGFEFSGKAFTWVKTLPSLARGPRLISTDTIQSVLAIGGGLTTRKNSESCWLGRRGKPSILSKGVREVILSPRRQHSRKPAEFFRRVEALCSGPRLELFARESRPGWTSWGDQMAELDQSPTRLLKEDGGDG